MSLTFPYYDPDDIELFNKIKEELNNPVTFNNLLNSVLRRFPEWIQFQSLEYADEVIKMDSSWNKICEMSGHRKQKILMVQIVCMNPNVPKTELLRLAAEKLTEWGCIVRNVLEFVPCGVCGKTIPADKIHKYLKLPGEFTGVCASCKD
jgi:hypothetical protein